MRLLTDISASAYSVLEDCWHTAKKKWTRQLAERPGWANVDIMAQDDGSELSGGVAEAPPHEKDCA